MNNSDIFIKKTECIKENTKISKNEIINSIPKDSLKTVNLDLAKIKTEWRWRFFKILNKNDIIEISFKKPNENRKYINRNSEWIDYTLGDEYDQYVVDSYYHYE
jgi:hypothetical protein